jgi:hypothetical protein
MSREEHGKGLRSEEVAQAKGDPCCRPIGVKLSRVRRKLRANSRASVTNTFRNTFAIRGRVIICALPVR